MGCPPASGRRTPASFGGGWFLAQHGMGGAWPCFAWRVLDSGSAWHGWSLAMLRLKGNGAQFAPTPSHVTSQLPVSSPAEALLGAGRSPGWARELFRRRKKKIKKEMERKVGGARRR